MSEEEIRDWNDLQKSYNQALNICPPDEYQARQRQLLYHVTEFLLEKFRPKETKEN